MSRWHIVTIFVLVSLVPAGALGLLGIRLFESQTRAEYRARLDAITESASRRVNERRTRERRAVARLCEGDFVVDRLLLDLEAERFGPYEQDDLVERLPNVMRSMGLVALTLIDAREGPRYGRVLAAGHFPGRAGSSDEPLARAVEEAGERWFVRELHVREDGETHAVQALLTGCVAERGSARVIAVGGQVLDDAFVDSLAADVAPIEVSLAPPDATTGAGEALDAPRRVHVFEDVRGRPAAALVAAIDDAPLRRNLAALWDRFWIILGAILLGALLFGIVLARIVTTPLGELESAASRVASGDMDTMIEIRRGGEVGKALSAFNRMTAEIQHAQARLIRAERIAAWRDIARRIAHEIKNPLMPIQTSIETMRKTHARRHPDFDEIFEESTVTILEEVERLKRIVTEFSDFARMPRPRPVELSVASIAQHVVGLHSGGDVEVRLVVEGEPPAVRADREQLTQVLVNLVQNAADAARARHGSHGGHVDVIVSPADEGVRVEVVDDGPGVPADEKGRIFEPYYTTKSGGTGLGLAIVHRIVSDHGGRIDVGDAEGGGAVFEIVLPREGPRLEASTTATDAALPLVQRR